MNFAINFWEFIYLSFYKFAMPSRGPTPYSCPSNRIDHKTKQFTYSPCSLWSHKESKKGEKSHRTRRTLHHQFVSVQCFNFTCWLLDCRLSLCRFGFLGWHFYGFQICAHVSTSYHAFFMNFPTCFSSNFRLANGSWSNDRCVFSNWKILREIEKFP